MNTYPDWYNMNIFDRLIESIPVVSYNCFNFRNIFNIIPLLYIILLMYTCYFSLKNNKAIRNSILIILSILLFLAMILDSGWIYFAIACLVFIIECYINIKCERKEVIPLVISMYSVTFSMIITPLYDSGRPDIYIHFAFIILLTIRIIDAIQTKEKVFKFCCISIYILLSLVLLFEIIEFTYIGKTHRKRLKDIDMAIKNNYDIVYLEKLNYPAELFQIEPNTIFYDDYYSTRYFKQYYNIPANIKFKPKE